MRVKCAAVVLLAMACGVSTWAQDKPAWQAMRGSGFEGTPLSLVPVGDAKKDKLPDVKDVWTGLVEGMAKDAETQKLLKKLLNCQAITVAVLPKKVDGNYRPAAPTGKSQVYFGIRLSAAEVGKDKLKGCVAGNARHMAFETPETRAWDKKATVWEAFVIAANEYLNRNEKGYHLSHGNLEEGLGSRFDGIDDAILVPAKRGAYVKKEIENFLATYKK